MKQDRQLSLFAVRDNPAIDCNSRLAQLALFSKIYAERALDLAKSGQKDSARNWSRFFEQSQILQSLSCSGLSASDLTDLTACFKALHHACHPQDVPAWETDIEAIRGELVEIKALLLEQKQPVFPFVSISPARSGAGVQLSGSNRN